MNAKNSLALVITLALTATAQEVEAAIGDIRQWFQMDDDTITPATAQAALVTGDSGTTAPTGVITQAGNHAPTVTANTELDKNGLPWDERIHASSKVLTDKGVWRARRGVSDATKTKVEKELRATLSATPPADTATPPTATATPPAPPSPAAPPAPPAPPAPAAPPANPAYTSFVQFIAEQTAAGRLDDAWVKTSLENFGIANGDIQNLAHRTDMIPGIEAAIRTALGMAK